MRRLLALAVAVMSASVVLVALPGTAGSRSPGTLAAVDPAAFQDVLTRLAGPPPSIGPLDAGARSVGFLTGDARFVEPGVEQALPTVSTARHQPATSSTGEWKAPRYTLTGEATFYDHGTTAMRLPRGTVVVVCAKGGCLERVVNDYGPVKESRIIDLYRPDFFAICGCPWYSGVIQVTVHVY